MTAVGPRGQDYQPSQEAHADPQTSCVASSDKRRGDSATSVIITMLPHTPVRSLGTQNGVAQCNLGGCTQIVTSMKTNNKLFQDGSDPNPDLACGGCGSHFSKWLM